MDSIREEISKLEQRYEELLTSPRSKKANSNSNNNEKKDTPKNKRKGATEDIASKSRVLTDVTNSRSKRTPRRNKMPAVSKTTPLGIS